MSTPWTERSPATPSPYITDYGTARVTYTIEIKGLGTLVLTMDGTKTREALDAYLIPAQ